MLVSGHDSIDAGRLLACGCQPDFFASYLPRGFRLFGVSIISYRRGVQSRISMFRLPSITMAKQKKRTVVLFIMAGAISCLSGCHVNRQFGSPGDMNTQRTRALLHDPFPVNDVGPEITGVRPRGFDLPRSEIQKLQTSPNARRGGQVPTQFGGF